MTKTAGSLALVALNCIRVSSASGIFTPKPGTSSSSYQRKNGENETKKKKLTSKSYNEKSMNKYFQSFSYSLFEINNGAAAVIEIKK